MAVRSSYNNMFRYVHFKPARKTDEIDEKVKKEISDGQRNDKGTSKRDVHQKLESKKAKAAIKELKKLDVTVDVDVESKESSSEFKKLTTIKKASIDKLSKDTQGYLNSLGLDTMKASYFKILNELNQKIGLDTITGSPEFDFSNQQPNGNAGYIQAVGTAQLLVVKQQLKRYEAADIAHIENILSGEKKIRKHDQLTRTEEFYSTVAEKTTDKESELETTERFELNKQVATTFQKDTEMGLDLSVSGKYGPTVSFESNFNIGQNTSEANSTNNATNYAKDVVERTKESVVEKVAVTQEKTLIREIKESNKHIIENESGNDHRFAIYQFVDKIYESQVFDYGKRQMFDFMVPEPASYLWYLKKNTPYKINLPEPLGLEDFGINEMGDLNKYNYRSLASYYKVGDLPQPPDIFVSKRTKLFYGTGEASDDGKFKSGVSGDMDIPDMYQPNLATINILATSDEDLHLSLHIGGDVVHFKKTDFEDIDVDGGHKRYAIEDKVMALGQDVTLGNGQKLFIDVYGYETANYNIHLDLRFYAIYDQEQLEYKVIMKWQQEVYGKLSEAYQNMLIQYQQERSILEAETEAKNEMEIDFGTAPSINQKLMHDELKKHCLALIRNEHLGTLNTPHVGEPPQFDIDGAKEDGEVIRFLEHAFEWGQLQYVLYPYFWSRPGDDQLGWIDRILTREDDFTFGEFLKAGYARVVVPVREGFEAAVSYFIENGNVYNNLGEPTLQNPLYVSIVDEIKERTGAGKDEIPVGDPWDTKLPTSAIIVRRTSTLPEWTKDPAKDWVWEAVPEN